MRFASSALRSETFKLVDIGCAGGIDPVWRSFANRLEALAIDASAAECSRLAAAEDLDVTYIAAFVSAFDKLIDLSTDPAWRVVLDACKRLSSSRMAEKKSARLKHASTAEQIRNNAWQLTDLANTGRPVVVRDLLRTRGWIQADYVKIDVDGADFEILRSLAGMFDELQVVAAQLEVNFVGGVEPHQHVFHNTDRFMRQQGFELFRLDVRNYSSSSLPSRFATTEPAQTETGRPVQGDAFYGRDVIDRPFALSDEKLLKLAAVFSAWDVPDAAADILVENSEQLGRLVEVERGLDMLAAQT